MKHLYCLLFVIATTLLSCDSPTKKDTQNIPNKEASEKEVIDTIPRNQILTSDEQITTALFAAPKIQREHAKVYGYDTNGNLIVLREGTNNFICIADNPKKDGFHAVAYHASLEPIMSRGRTLSSEGKSRKEKEAIRASEAKSGDLKLPTTPATLHVYYGKDGFFNKKSDSIENAKYRYVVYIPYATQESTGLPVSPNESNHPWLMFPGKYNAHIMITPK